MYYPLEHQFIQLKKPPPIHPYRIAHAGAPIIALDGFIKIPGPNDMQGISEELHSHRISNGN